MAISDHNLECCGCAACVDVCPQKAISMVEDNETFLYPHVDTSLCIDCNLCEKVCPLNFSDFQEVDDVKSFVGTHKSEDVIYDSSSGGAFTALLQIYTQNGYSVYGAEYCDHLQVKHGVARSLEDCFKFRKSKYIQSNTEGCFRSVAEDLKAGYKVLFSGVSCQIAALKNFLKTKSIPIDGLVTVNILCHGVPSQKIFDCYIAEEEEEGARVYQFRFKNKNAVKEEINSRTAYVEFNNGHKYIRTIQNDPFLRGYYRRLFYRPSCAVCHFTRKERISDFTIADAWNIEKLYPEFNPLAGCSLILLNTSKALDVLEEIKKVMVLTEVSSEWALNSQALFKKPTSMHKNRDLFFKRWRKMSFRRAVFSCTRPTVSKLLAGFIPKDVKEQMKKTLLMKICLNG